MLPELEEIKVFKFWEKGYDAFAVIKRHKRLWKPKKLKMRKRGNVIQRLRES